MDTDTLHIDELNSEQRKAILHTQGPLRLIAGAGSGKTKVLTTKVAYLIKELNMNPAKILAVTFTKKAADEMLERVLNLVGFEGERPIISTFHALCTKILRYEIHNMEYPNNFKIIDESEQKQILKMVYDQLNVDSDLYSISSSLAFISNEKTNLRKPKHSKELAEEDDLRPEIYDAYVQYLKRYKSLDFDDLLVFVHDLFYNEKHENIRHKWENMFDYVLVDEFQDTSHVQYDIVKILAKKQNIMIVGDPDQTIYTWRNADINIIINFQKDFPNQETIKLEQNYRSTKKILDAANKLISNNSLRVEKKLFTENEDGEDIEFYCGFSDEAEARWISKKINDLKRNRVQLKNIAIIYRTNSYSRAIEEQLISESTNHLVVGGIRFYEREEIKDAIAYLRMIFIPDDIALQQVINKPLRKIGKETVRKLSDFAFSNNMSMFQALEDKFKEIYSQLGLSRQTMEGLADFVNIVRWGKSKIIKDKMKVSQMIKKLMIEKVGYFKKLKLQPEQIQSKEENFAELLNAIETWEEKNKNRDITEYLQEIAILGDDKTGGDPSSSVSLMTVHNAKGLEFDYVFIAGLAEKIFPHFRSITPKGEKPTIFGSAPKRLDVENIELIEEERRLAYVAFTRAKKKLFLSFSTARQNEESRFISEAGIKGRGISKGISIASTFANGQEIHENDRIIQGDRIVHSKFGEGVVLEVQGEIIKVKFDSEGNVKSLTKNHASIRRKE
ncbi:ATP-dependent helicase [[Mycoplasma] gypis]|uniref:DNA 3'-5' helicase n=1 Tax=[Mycoplasma] gypis TaxID=92404 RepID=A0ABZ2RMW2_9BACT|nr:UvrD-helicase domain-containing protein [[Mycoplasma] gypis]MBN0919497.1 UvrD-helicase domain-containing protein [[Mycoplasma] gypis]